jgi:outer membrane scaffolding protein for murein synthesis (MipA/OmpV family)
MRAPLAIAAAGALLAVAGPAHAEAPAEDRPLWELGAGLGHLKLPTYRGSDRTHDWWLPVPYFVYRGEILRADREGTRAVLLEADRFDFDLSFAASAPVQSDGNDARAGMPDLKPSVEIGPQLNVRLARAPGWKVDLRAPLRAVVLLRGGVRDTGWSASPVINLDVEIPQGNVGLQAGALWGSRRLNRYYYDVPAAYATAERPAYTAGSGYAGWQLTAAVSRRIGNFWLGGFVRRDSLDGAVFEDSPLVRRRDQWTYGFAVSWVFARSERRVPNRP